MTAFCCEQESEFTVFLSVVLEAQEEADVTKIQLIERSRTKRGKASKKGGENRYNKSFNICHHSSAVTSTQTTTAESANV